MLLCGPPGGAAGWGPRLPRTGGVYFIGSPIGARRGSGGDFSAQTASPLFVVKMAAVALVTVYVGAMHVFMRRAAGGNAAAAQRVALYAPWGLVIAPLPVIFAVLTFS